MIFLQENDIVSAFVPVDTQTGANAGDYVCLKNWKRVAYVLFKAAGKANDDPVVTFYQATAVAGTDAKVLTKCDECYYKEGTLTSVGTWTKATQTAASTYTAGTSSAESQGIYVFEFDASDLDVANGFDCFMASLADTGAAGAQLGCGFYILSGPRYAQETLPTPITD